MMSLRIGYVVPMAFAKAVRLGRGAILAARIRSRGEVGPWLQVERGAGSADRRMLDGCSTATSTSGVAASWRSQSAGIYVSAVGHG